MKTMENGGKEMAHAQRYTLNRLLAALPPDDYTRISPLLTFGPLRSRQILQKRDEPLREIYFPSQSLCSFILTMADGARAEIAVVGAEGVVGVEAVLGLRTAICDATVQVAGEGVAHTMDADAFRAELDRQGALHDLVQKYAQAFVGFVTQSVACNGLHSVEARCCRWLLHAHDRLGGSEFPLTHDLLSTMLGVRRPTVTLVMATLAQLGIISTSRGAIRIVSTDALDARSCGCYRAVKGVFDQVFPPEVVEQRERPTPAWSAEMAT
jgi:CRP-like cAMP-binding protein